MSADKKKLSQGFSFEKNLAPYAKNTVDAPAERYIQSCDLFYMTHCSVQCTYMYSALIGTNLLYSMTIYPEWIYISTLQ